MVFFTCNACGSSLKKNQVEKHYQNECKSCSVLSCMDCGQDFYGDEYAGHTQCISEAQKYQGSMFKGTGNKGDKKQQEWLEKARLAMQSAKVNPKLKSLLEKVSEYPNIPRKKSKFENFVRNSCNVRDRKTLEELWDIFNQDVQPATCAASMNSREGEKLEKEVVPQETGCDVVNSESLVKKKKIKIAKPCETEMKEEVDCDGPVKKKKKQMTVEEDCDGPKKKGKTEMRKVEEEQENVANERKKKREKRVAATVTQSVFDEEKLVDKEKVRGLKSADEEHEVVVIGTKRKHRSEGSQKKKVVCQDTAVVSSAVHTQEEKKRTKIKH